MDVGLVCDSCSTFNPMGASACSACGSSLSLDAATGPGASAAPEAQGGCPACSAVIPPGFRFCGSCGYRIDEAPAAPAAARPAVGSGPSPAPRSGAGKKTMFFGAMQANRAKLVLIKGDGLDGVSYSLAGEEHLAGREDGALLFDEDPFLSPVHANFFYRSSKLVVRDESSTNGVYLRIRGSRVVQLGDRFLVGEQLLELQPCSERDERPREDGTYFFASPRRQSHFRLLQVLRGGETGMAFRPDSDVVRIGREGNDIDFPDDPFISGHHAQVAFTDGRLTLTDLGSKNGTFVRINDEQVLEHGDYVFMGQQLLRVEIV
jgi:pSer/pThr/pTyr-binding forkhead associated (FHA) protein